MPVSLPQHALPDPIEISNNRSCCDDDVLVKIPTLKSPRCKKQNGMGISEWMSWKWRSPHKEDGAVVVGTEAGTDKDQPN